MYTSVVQTNTQTKQNKKQQRQQKPEEEQNTEDWQQSAASTLTVTAANLWTDRDEHKPDAEHENQRRRASSSQIPLSAQRWLSPVARIVRKSVAIFLPR